MICIMVLLLFFTSNLAFAACSLHGDAVRQINIMLNDGRVLKKPLNSTPGTILWESNWRDAGTIGKITCNNSGEYTSGYLSAPLTKLAAGFTDVFETTVPGVGIRIYFCKNETCSPPPAGAYMGKAVTGTQESKTNFEINIGPGPFYNLRPQFLVQLIATSGNLGSGMLTFPGRVATALYGPQDMAVLNLVGTLDIRTAACTVKSDSKNLTVSLPMVNKQDFSPSNPILADINKVKSFRLKIDCSGNGGVLPSWRFEGVTAAPDVLANGSVSDAAEGVGIQLFRGGADSTQVQALDTWIDNEQRLPENDIIYIESYFDLTAKYYRTANSPLEIKQGNIRAVAVFNLRYL